MTVRLCSRSVRYAEPDEASSVLRILNEATLWSTRFGEPVWMPNGFSLAEQRSLAIRREQVGAYDGDMMVGCMRLQREDLLFWPDDCAGDALYVHKMAVVRAHAGLAWANRLIDFAVESARSQSIGYVKLDTVPLPRMLELYTDMGFVVVDREPRSFGGRLLVRLEKAV